VDVLADLRSVPCSSWFMVAKVDVSEIFADARYHSGVILLLVVLGIIMTVLLAAFVGSFQRKRAEEALRKSESKYKILVEHIPLKIFIKDRNLVYLSCNELYAVDLKINPDYITGKTDYDFFLKELAEKYRRDDEKVIKTGKIEDIEERYIQDGQELWSRTVKNTA